MSVLTINLQSSPGAGQCHMGSYSSVDTMNFSQLTSALLLVSFYENLMSSLSPSLITLLSLDQFSVGNLQSSPRRSPRFSLQRGPTVGSPSRCGVWPPPARRIKTLKNNIKTFSGLAGGSLVTAGLGFAGKNSLLNTINTISNVANAKIGW